MTALAQLQSAIHLLQAGRPDEAESVLATLLASEPQNADAHALTGLALAQRGENERAADAMARALKLNPNHPATLVNHAKVLRNLERWDEALDAAARALDLRPDHAEARRIRGHVLAQLSRAAEALSELDHIATDHIDTLTLRAKLRFQAARAADAVADYDRIVALDPENWEAFNNRGIALDQLERYDEALTSYNRALALRPNEGDILHNRGATLICLQRYDEALPLFEHLIETDPTHADNWSCHGVALASLMRLDEALISFKRGLALDPTSLRALNGTGMAEVALCRTNEAVATYTEALRHHPADPMTHTNLAFAHLVGGNLTDGFAEYEWRRKDGQIARQQRNYAQPEWQGEDIAGKTLLVHPEQGLGDTVQFARLVRDVERKGARVILEVQPPLETLLQTLRAEATVIRTGMTPPPFDLHAPLMSLPHRLGLALETIPSAPYIYADETKRAVWRERLGALSGKRVGLCWAGNRTHRNDHARSIPLKDVAALTNVPNISIVSLQREVRDTDAALLKSLANVTDLMHHVSDFADTAALIAELDLVITVDTSVAHVAGALGKPVWIMIVAAPDWRWLLDRDDSPWYPTARLFRQEKLGDWPGVVTRVRDALSKV